MATTENRETWAMSLHLSNDEGLYLMVSEWARDALDEADREYPELSSLDHRATRLLGERLEEWMDEVAQTTIIDGNAGFWSKEVRAMLEEVGSLWRVDWTGVAIPYVEQALEEVA